MCGGSAPNDLSKLSLKSLSMHSASIWCPISLLLTQDYTDVALKLNRKFLFPLGLMRSNWQEPLVERCGFQCEQLCFI